MQEKIIKKYGIDPKILDYSTPTSTVKTVGLSSRNGKWYGWSHRAISGFNSKEKAKAFARSVS